MVRLGLKPIIFVINNDGFTIERFIHGMDASYNDIQSWKHVELASVFGAKEGTFKTYQVKTKDETNKLFAEEEFNAAGKLQIVEVFVPKKDAPRSLKLTAEASAKNNAK